MKLTRRGLIQASLALCIASPFPVRAAADPAVHVLKSRGCGCCNAWIDILISEGFTVTAEDVPLGLLAREKVLKGIPTQFASCHTALVDGYVVEGHVPAADIRRLLEEKPDTVGLSVPGMPFGSPGMGPESEREAYDVVLIRRDGTAEVFTSYDAGK